MLDFPEVSTIADFETLSYPEVEIVLLDRCVYFFTSKDYGKTKYSNTKAENKLNVRATTRNHRTMNTLAEMARSLAD